MLDLLEYINRFVWGIPALILILGTGLYLSFCTGFAQFRLLPRALRMFFCQLFGRGDRHKSGVTPFQALCTALAATVGTGNIAGVAGAIAIGGPGAVFWMWICAFLGMVTKYAEAVLAVRYRRKIEGDYIGGPMYMIRNGMGKRWRPLAGIYSFFGVIAAFGVGNATQINAVVTGLNQTLGFFGLEPSAAGNLIAGIALAVLVSVMLLGGAGRIGAAAERLVPFASAAYLLLGLGVLILRANALPHAFAMIMQSAFSPQAATGGVVGSALIALRTGVSRGVFTNEAGMGTAGMAHASAQTDHPVRQGMLGIVEVFVDTILICTMTALVILCSGVPIPYGTDPGAALTSQAFTCIYGEGAAVFLTLALCCFAFATVLGWGLYGIRCAQYLFGADVWRFFAVAQALMVVLGAVLETRTVWLLAETVNGLMAIPNLIALIILSPELTRLTNEFQQMIRDTSSVPGGVYENFY